MANSPPAVLIPGPAGQLEVLPELPDAEFTSKTVALICHPHPLHGGTLHNKVAHSLARAARELGAISVRFNFRGVAQSHGAFAHGRGEREDLLSVWRWALATYQPRAVWLAGFSFGAYVSLLGHREIRPQRLVLVAPPVRYCGGEDCVLDATIPSLVIQGDADTVVAADSVAAWVAAQTGDLKYCVMPGAAHFFHGRLTDLRTAVKNWCDEVKHD